MNTCVSMTCPFIAYCKDYNYLVDRTGGCKTQDAILRAAKRLQKQRVYEKRLAELKSEAND